MSFANPTPLRIGMSGTLAGKRFRVVGRVVMGMDDGGETYYWNEFNLRADDGESTTLVYEVTERGGEWKLFTMFEPEYPMTAADAATKRVGHRLNLTGKDVRVTLVDESRVYHIEGEAPEGVEIGDVARYFNAEAGQTMQVVSWTGDEVEYYSGVTLSRNTVPTAFGFRVPASASFLESAGGNEESSFSAGTALKFVILFLIAAIFFAGHFSCEPFRSRPVVVKIKAPAALLTLGSTGIIGGRNRRVASHTVTEIAQVGLIYERHEYRITDDDGNSALLIFGLKPKEKDWVFCTPLEPMNTPTPQQAAALRTGDSVNIDGYVAQVADIFRSTIRQVEQQNPASSDGKSGDEFYCFSGKSGTALLLARWNGTGIAFYKGSVLSAKEMAAAFSSHDQ